MLSTNVFINLETVSWGRSQSQHIIKINFKRSMSLYVSTTQHLPRMVYGEEWRSCQHAASWSPWTCDTVSFLSHQPAQHTMTIHSATVLAVSDAMLRQYRINVMSVPSSTCLMAMLIRSEFIEVSIRTFSFSLRLITTGCRSSSRLLLYIAIII